MIARGKKNAGPIGIDLGSRTIKMVQLCHEPSGLEMRARIRPLPAADWRSNSGQVASLIQQMLREGDFTGHSVVASLPDDLVEYRNMQLDEAPARQLDDIVHEHMGEHLKLEGDQYNTQYLDAGEVWKDDERRREIIAMAAPVAGIDEFLKLLSRCRLTPLVIEVAPSALIRSLAGPSKPDGDRPILFVDIGYESVMLTISKGGSIRFLRRLGLGLAKFDDVVAGQLHVAREQAEIVRDTLAGDSDWPLDGIPREAAERTVQEAVRSWGYRLVRDIAKSLQYYGVTFREDRPESGVVIGGGVRVPGLLAVIRKESGLALATVDTLSELPWVSSARTLSRTTPPSILAVAAGSSQHGEIKKAKAAA